MGAQFNPRALKLSHLERLKKQKPDEIIVAGMGGSGLPGELVVGMRNSLGFRVPVTVWHDYGLPQTKSKRPLYLCVSFSGNTEETLSGLTQILRRKRQAVALVTTGGKMKAIGEQHKLPMVTFRASDLTPREALGYAYCGLVTILRIVFPTIRQFSPTLHPGRFNATAHALARSLRSRIPLIYTDQSHAVLGYIWKINFNETAKHPAFTNVFPELVHNEIAGLEDKKFPFIALILIDKPNAKISKKIRAFKTILKNFHVPTVELRLAGKNFEERVWNSIILSHLTSFHLAGLKHVNPLQTKSIELLKKLTK